jgi:hypothetical protein
MLAHTFRDLPPPSADPKSAHPNSAVSGAV